MIRKPAMLAHTMWRRILLTGGSGVLSTIAPDGFGTAATEEGAGLATGAALGGAAADTVLSGVITSPDWLSTILQLLRNLES